MKISSIYISTPELGSGVQYIIDNCKICIQDCIDMHIKSEIYLEEILYVPIILPIEFAGFANTSNKIRRKRAYIQYEIDHKAWVDDDSISNRRKLYLNGLACGLSGFPCGIIENPTLENIIRDIKIMGDV